MIKKYFYLFLASSMLVFAHTQAEETSMEGVEHAQIDESVSDTPDTSHESAPNDNGKASTETEEEEEEPSLTDSTDLNTGSAKTSKDFFEANYTPSEKEDKEE